jgi:hypothetical protein
VSKPVQLKQTIDDFLKNIKQTNQISIEVFEGVFRQNLDKGVLRHINFVKFKDGVLKIRVDTSVWLCELNLRKPDLLKKLKDAVGGNTVKDIKIFIGELK